MTDKPPDPDEPPFMPCMGTDCRREATHSSSRWPTAGHMEVLYWCEAHAPADATSFDEDEAAEDQADILAATEALRDAAEHGTVPWEQVRAKLGLGDPGPGADR